MAEPFIGSEAPAAGTLSKHELRTYYAAISPNVYLERRVTPTLRRNARVPSSVKTRADLLLEGEWQLLGGLPVTAPERTAFEYDGDRHRTSRPQFVKDAERLEYIQQVGSTHIKVLAEHRATT